MTRQPAMRSGPEHGANFARRCNDLFHGILARRPTEILSTSVQAEVASGRSAGRVWRRTYGSPRCLRLRIATATKPLWLGHKGAIILPEAGSPGKSS